MFLGVLSSGNHLIHYLPELVQAPANGTTTTIVLDNLTYGFHALDHFWGALAESEVHIIGWGVLLIHEDNWVCSATAVWTPEDVSVLNNNPTASDEFGLDRKEEECPYKHGPLDSIVTKSPVIECFEEINEDEAEEDGSPLFTLSSIDFAHT
ncbi:hypothetical protein BKA82DRAFT_4019574 [Pisolithus tinctorius]|nr:hypothetical protein BKA82DRAFT_4019574 [Pisolithus tinctorius]